MQDFRSLLEQSDPAISKALQGEEVRQHNGIELIPSENYTYPEVLALLGSVFTNKYSEGYPGKRFYGGQTFTDRIERIACTRACELFHAQHANVQPLSGSIMNQAVYLALLEPHDTILAMDLSHGGHLTHGAPVSHMGRLFNFVRYKTEENGSIDFDSVRALTLKYKPKLVLCGHSSYPKDLDYAQFKSIADEVGALTMVDMSHYAGLVAGDNLSNPFDYDFDIATTTTHKSLRGPRGGLILCKEKFAKLIDKSVFPGIQGGPHMNQIAATAFTLLKASQPDFKIYAKNILNNASTLADSLLNHGIKLITGGTENHLIVIDTISSFGINGVNAQNLLDEVHITTNKQVIPDDPLSPSEASGIRIGTPAATTRGFNTKDMMLIGNWIAQILQNPKDAAIHQKVKTQVVDLCLSMPVPGIH